MKVGLIDKILYLCVCVSLIIAFECSVFAFPYFYSEATVMSGTISKSNITVSSGYSSESVGSWPAEYNTWIAYPSRTTTKNYFNVINYNTGSATSCSGGGQTNSNGFDILANCKYINLPDSEYGDSSCSDYTNYMSYFVDIIAGSYSTQTTTESDADPNNQYSCTFPTANNTIDYSRSLSSNHVIKFDKCSPDQKIKLVVIEGKVSTIWSSDAETFANFLINGISPAVTNKGKVLYGSNYCSGLPNSYNSSADVKWVIPVEAACNDTYAINISGSPGLFYGYIKNIRICNIKVNSLTTTSQPLDITSGGNVGINGSISDSSGQALTWTIKLLDRTFTGSGTSASATWDGNDASGNFVAPGTYTATLTAKTADGNCRDSKSIQVTVKSVCDLNVSGLSGTSNMLSPYSGGNVGIKGTLSDSSNQPITWTLNILDQTFTGSGKSVNEIWNGKYADGTIVEEGEYSATLTAQTADGKCTDSKTINFTVTKAEDGQCGLYVQFGSSAHMASGNLSHSQELFSSRGGALPAGMSLYYNSLDPAKGSLGRGWSHNYDLSLKENSNGSVLISEGNWKHKYYTLANGMYSGRTGNSSTLAKNTDGSFTLTHKDGQVYTFANGKIATIADRNGNTTAFAYSGGNLATVTDPSGRVVSFTYDSANHLTSLTDPSGNAYAFTVGDALTSVTQPDGGAWRYTYDANSFMLTKANPLGNVTSYTYDDQHRATTATDPEGKTRSIAYPLTSDSVKTTRFTEKDAGVWNYSYDTQSGYLLGKTDPQGGTTSYGYDANGNRTSTTNLDGTSTSATYDATGNTLTSTDALGQSTGYAYNSFGQVTGITDPQGGTTTYAYDAKGNLTALTDSTGATTTYAYDAKGNITKVTDAAGLVTSFTYDATGNLATVTDSSGATSKYGYDAAGNVTSITDAKGSVTTYVYDNRNRLIKSIDPNGNITLYSYDANGNKLSETDANGNITRYEYNGKNKLIKTIDAMGNSTTYSYGGSSCPSCGGGNGEKLTTLTDANGNSTSYLYDQLGRLEKETDPKGNATNYTYDAKGNLTSKTDANGATISYSYDSNGRLLKKRYPDSTEETFTYDPKGNILSATNKDISYNFSYDAAGRMTSSTDSNSRYLQYSYDTTGKKTKTIYPEGSVVSYAYDNAGRLAAITNGGGRTYSYSYDKLGRRTKLAYPNGATANYGYDTAGRLTNLDHKTSSNKIITSFSYTHDKVGNRLTKSEPDTTWNYGYDAVYRLLQALPLKPNGKEKEDGSGPEKYSYDPTGNRLVGPQKQDNYSYGPGNQLLTDRPLGYSYDKNGNLTAKGKTKSGDDDQYENDVDQHDGKGWAYTYDFENRLIKAEQGDTVITFKYDPLGRRIEKQVAKRDKKDDDDAVTHTYVYDGQAIILEYETTGDEHHNKTEATKYVHGPGIDEPLAITRDNEVFYYHADGLGSIVALTDKKQKVVVDYEYDSFGYLKAGIKPIQPFAYTGREWDKETGLYYYRARYYDPIEGRFVSKDPIGFAGGDANLYGYTQQNPVNYTDPTGLLTSAGALAHYLGGSGTALSMQFNEINTGSVRVTRFPQVQSELKKGCGNRTVRIDSRSSYSTSGDAALTVGGITLRLQGELTICGCNWSFKGNLRSFDDTYDFNPSTHRSLLGELLTTVGNNLPGKSYTINIMGEKPISASGTLK